MPDRRLNIIHQQRPSTTSTASLTNTNTTNDDSNPIDEFNELDIGPLKEQLRQNQYYIEPRQNQIYKIEKITTSVDYEIIMDYCCTKYDDEILYKEDYMTNPHYPGHKREPTIITNIDDYVKEYESIKQKDTLTEDVLNDLKAKYSDIIIFIREFNSLEPFDKNYDPISEEKLNKLILKKQLEEDKTRYGEYSTFAPKKTSKTLYYISKSDPKTVYEATFNKRGDMDVNEYGTIKNIKLGDYVRVRSGLNQNDTIFGIDQGQVLSRKKWYERSKPIKIKIEDIEKYNNNYSALIADPNNTDPDEIMEKLHEEQKDNPYSQFLKDKRLYVGGHKLKKSLKQRKSKKPKKSKIQKKTRKRRLLSTRPRSA